MLVVAACLLAGCGSGRSAATSAAPQQATVTVAPLPTSAQSHVFQPAFTYTLPPGWFNSEDFAALFRLLPRGFSNDQFDQGEVDGVTLIAGAGAANLDCTDTMAPGVGLNPEAIATELLSRPGIAGTKRVASIGGLSGLVLDVRLAPGWTTSCPDPPGVPTVPLINGPEHYNQRAGGDTLIRLYLLDLRGSSLSTTSTLAIELDDRTGGDHIENLSKIATGITFVP
jgi:hypothetical protein